MHFISQHSRIWYVFLLLLGIFSGTAAFSEETLGEKVGSSTHNVKRSLKKHAHRAQESRCAKGDAKCLGDKAKNRAEEGVDYVDDKAKETKNKID